MRSAMISPRSFIYSRRPPSSPSFSSTSPTSPQTISSPSSPTSHVTKAESRPLLATSSYLIEDATTTHNTDQRHITASPKYDQTKSLVTVCIEPIPSTTDSPTSITPLHVVTMGKRKDRVEGGLSAPSRAPQETTVSLTRPSTPSSPVQIPRSRNRSTAHPQKRNTSERRKTNNVQSPDDVSPSMATLLAMTDIPRQRSTRRRPKKEKPLTVNEVIDGQQVSEKELSLSLRGSPMDILLSPPEEFVDDEDSVSDINIGSAISTRTLSVDSIPSLGGSFVTDNASSLETASSPGLSLRGRRVSPVRKSLEPCLSPPGEEEEHPLAGCQYVVQEPEEVDSSANAEDDDSSSLFLGQLKPLKLAFKSNLTASFRALRSAAKSFSTINFSSIPSEDLLTRSLLTIDTNVPYADERRPPVSEDIPTAEMRRYLNPTTSSRIESQLATVPPPGTFSASIQMQTYKVQRSKLGSSRNQSPRVPPRSSSQPSAPSEPLTAHSMPPTMRQREMRENSDFIRIAVMEMAMRKRGKLDDQRPGRARWALPPRRTSTTPYEVGSNGVPARWRSVTY